MKYLRDVATISIITDKCVGCGMCVEVCPRNVIALKGKKAFIIDRDACVECGACAKNCAYEAIIGDFGVGCATAMINGLVRFGDPDKGSCDCDGTSGSSGCC